MVGGQTVAQPHRQFKCLVVVHRFKCSFHVHQYTITAGGLLFSDKLLDIADLQSVPVVAQALDNQWVPRELLGPAFQAGAITPAIDKQLRKLVRSEYIRS